MLPIPQEKDPIGSALLDYVNGVWDGEEIAVNTNYTEDEVLPVAYFFREWDEMPLMEQEAIRLSKGKILDAGAGAGCHALELEKRGFDVTAMEICEASVEVMKKRGIKKVVLADFMDAEEKYDTILLLMNGAGVLQNVEGMNDFFANKLDILLEEGGQLLVDSSDLIYLFQEGDGSIMIDLNANYHGEVDFEVSYKKVIGEPFKWLFVGYDVLSHSAEQHGFKCEKVVEGTHFDYLARISRD